MSRKPDQPQQWSVHAEFTIHHPGVADPDNGAHTETIRDDNGVRMTYTWASQVNNPTNIWGTQSNIPSAPSSTYSDSTPRPFTFSESGKSFTPGNIDNRGYRFQRGNMLFTSIPPPRRTFITPENNPSSSMSATLKQDSSGYGSDLLSPNSFASGSLPRRPPVQPYNRKCKSTCNIVLSTNIREEVEDDTASASQCCRTQSLRCQTPTARYERRANFYGCGDPWCHHANYGDEFTGSGRFSPVPEMCEECPSVQSADNRPSRASTFTSHCCDHSRTSLQRESDRKDACVQTFEMTDKCTSPIMKIGSPGFRKDGESKKKCGLRRRTEPIRQRSRSPSTITPDSLDTKLPRRLNRSPKQKKISGISLDKKGSGSDSKSSDPSKKPRTVHIDVYCTGTEMESNGSSSSSDASDNETASTPQTVFESSAMKITHARADKNTLPHSIRSKETVVPKSNMMQKQVCKEESDMDDNASTAYPSKLSSYSTIRDFASSISSVPRSWMSYSTSSCTVPDEFDSIANTSWKDTFSDIDSLLQSRSSIAPTDSLLQSRSSIAPTDSFDFLPRRLYGQTPSIEEIPETGKKQHLGTPSVSSLQQSDSFEYANSEDKLRIKRMEEMLSKSQLTKVQPKAVKSPQLERRQLVRQKKINEYMERRLKQLNKSSKSRDSDSEGTDDDEMGWTFVKDDNKKLERDTTVRRASKEMEEKSVNRPETIVEETCQEKPAVTKLSNKTKLAKTSDQGSLSDSSSSCSKSPSAAALRQRMTLDPTLRSPFSIFPGHYTEQRNIAKRFGPVVSAFRKPGHHIGPAKNPNCLCDHCKRYFEEVGYRNRTRSLGDPPLDPVQNWREFVKPVNLPEDITKNHKCSKISEDVL